MEEDSPIPQSPPLPKKGSYSIDFDNLDEFSNPFQSKNKVQMGSSPPIHSNATYDFNEDEDPFKSKKTLANSPPGSPKIAQKFNEDQGMICDAGLEDELSTQLPISEKSADAAPAEVEKKANSQVTPKKKKIIKKPQVQSKFKPPRNLKKNNNHTNDIEILMPGMEPESNHQVTENAETEISQPSEINHQIVTEHQAAMEDGPPPQDAAPDAMALSTEIDRHFIDGDDYGPDGLAASHEEFKDASEWTASSQNGRSGHTEQSERPSRGASKTSIDHHKKGDGHEKAEVNPPPCESESSKEKHPALRALQATQSNEPSPVGKSPESSMEKTTCSTESAENKGTVVQLVQVLRYSQTDWNKMKQELELNFQTNLLNKERDWSRLLADRDKKLSSLDDTNKKLKSTNEDMRAVVTEFEKTIAQLQSEKDKTKSESHKSIQDLEGERNQALEDLASVETAFSDLHRRYEKSKTIIEGFKRNEEQLKECVEDLKSKLKKSESKLISLRCQAEEKLDKANEDIEKIKKSTKSEVVRLEAALKKSDLRISSLDEALSRKEKENQELTAICDELIAKVGS